MGKQRTKDADEPAPTNPAALVCLTMTTKPTFRAEFKPGEGWNKWGARRLHGPPASPRLATASLRHGESTTRRICGPPRRIYDWINARGEKGPWSEITTATVAA